MEAEKIITQVGDKAKWYEIAQLPANVLLFITLFIIIIIIIITSFLNPYLH